MCPGCRFIFGYQLTEMKKIIIAFEGLHFSRGAFEFARKLNEKDRILLTGVFLPQVMLSNLWSYADGANGPMFIPLVEGTDAELISKNIDLFTDLCKKNDIDFRVHKDFYDFALPELKKETLCADLLVLGSESFYSNIGQGEPNDYLKEALHEAECPVVVVPESFDFPANNILAFDGSPSAIYAIKQFSYLFPEFTANPTLVVHVGEENEDQIKNAFIAEWAAKHFSVLTISNIHLDAKKYFSTWMSGRKACMLVAGAFGRSAFSRLLRKSFVFDILKDHRVPLLIAHK
jgi:hypothetical protein